MIELSEDQSGLCHDNIAFHTACGFPWRDSFILNPNVHFIKYLRTLEAFRKIGVDSKHTSTCTGFGLISIEENAHTRASPLCSTFCFYP